jgi:hypothetical protein
MTVINPEQTLTIQLIALKSQYEQALTEADAKATHVREQLSHINALLLNQLVPSGTITSLRAHIEPSATALALRPQVEDANAPIPLLTFEEGLSQGKGQPRTVKPRQKKAASAASKPTQASRKGSSLTLVPAYQGLKRLDAIAKVLSTKRGNEVTLDTLTQSLFGDLNTTEHKKERLRLKTLLYQGVKQGLWQKAATPSSYLIATGEGKGRSKKKSAPQASSLSPEAAVETLQPSARKASEKTSKPRTQKKAATAQAAKPKLGSTPATKKRNSLPLLPAFTGITKLEAIRTVLQSYGGQDLHHDTIIQSLYGDLSPADLKAERVRIKTALLTGVKNNLWGKSPKPSTYRLEALNPPNESNGKGAIAPSSASRSATKTPAAKGRKKPVAAKVPTRSKAPRTSSKKAK